MFAKAQRSLWGLLLGAALALPGAAYAQEDQPPEPSPPQTETGEEEEAEPGTEPSRERVVVLLMSVGAVEPQVADSLSEVLIGTLAARGGVTILGREEFQAQLGQGDAGTLECVSSLACLGRVGVQLDVEQVVAGTIARREGVWVFNLNRVNVSSGEVEGRVFREIEGDLAGVADALHEAIPELYEPLPSPDPTPEPPRQVTGGLAVACNVDGAEVLLDGALLGSTAGGRLDRAGLEPGSHEVVVLASGYHRWGRTVRIDEASTAHVEVRLREAWDETVHPVVWVAGAIAVAAFAAAIPLGVSSQDDLDLSLDNRRAMTPTRGEALTYYDDRAREALAANILFGVGAAAAVTALVSLFFPERARRDAPERAGLRVVPGGIEGWF